jgi:hypothetical protein
MTSEMKTDTPSQTHSYPSSKRLQDLIPIDAAENFSTSTGTTTSGIKSETLSQAHSYFSSKRSQELNHMDAVESLSALTSATMGGDLNK